MAKSKAGITQQVIKRKIASIPEEIMKIQLAGH
jgi:hypothetical protein